MNRFLSAALLLVAAAGAIHCAAPTDDADVSVVDVSVDPQAISGASSGETTGSGSVEKTPEGGTKQQPYLKIELNNTLVTSY